VQHYFFKKNIRPYEFESTILSSEALSVAMKLEEREAYIKNYERCERFQPRTATGHQSVSQCASTDDVFWHRF